MRHSIRWRIGRYFIILAILIIGFVAVSVRFFLPAYYTNKQLGQLESYEMELRDSYGNVSDTEIVTIMVDLQSNVGGGLYTYNEEGQFQGYGSGKGKGSMVGAGQNSEDNEKDGFKPVGNITEYTYENSANQEIYVLGVLIAEDYLVYEVELAELSGAVDVIMDFIWLVLIVSILLALILSLSVSRKIASPIRALSKLADQMKDKKVTSIMVVDTDDEIGQLNRNLNGLYEELLSSIYQLESELDKERNTEQLKKRFLAQATHELKTPIAVIRGYTEILYDGMYKDEDDRDEYLKHIYEETESLSHLILDVLDYTRMETNNYILSKESVEINTYFGQLFQRYEAYAEDAGLTYTYDVNLPKGTTLEFDQKRVEQVVKNLLSNAIEHAESSVDVSVQYDAGHFRLTVANNGPCIDEMDLPNIFDSFYKKKGKQSGSGLGLAIVKEIVRLHGGHYRVENLEQGVKFIINI